MPFSSSIHYRSIGANRPRGPWHIRAHHHGFHELVVILRGAERVVCAERDATVQAGEALLFAPGVTHEEWALNPEPLETYFCAFEAPDLPPGLPLAVADKAGRLRQLAAWLHAERDRVRGQAPALTVALLAALVAEFQRLAAQREAPLVEHLRRAVRERPDAAFTLAGLAAQAGLSKFHYLRVFKALAGRTPMAEVQALRLAHARDLLLSTDLPLKRIAPQAGLGDAASLARLCRRHFGLTPGQLRGRR